MLLGRVTSLSSSVIRRNGRTNLGQTLLHELRDDHPIQSTRFLHSIERKRIRFRSTGNCAKEHGSSQRSGLHSSAFSASPCVVRFTYIHALNLPFKRHHGNPNLSPAHLTSEECHASESPHTSLHNWSLSTKVPHPFEALCPPKWRSQPPLFGAVQDAGWKQR